MTDPASTVRATTVARGRNSSAEARASPRPPADRRDGIATSAPQARATSGSIEMTTAVTAYATAQARVLGGRVVDHGPRAALTSSAGDPDQNCPRGTRPCTEEP